MTERNAIREAVYQRVTAAWAGLTPLDYEGDPPYDPPNGPWGRVSLKHTGGSQQTLGGPGTRKFERRGSIFVQLFEPPGRGLSGQDDLVDRASKVFEGCDMPGTTVLLFNPVGRDIGVIENGRWQAAVVEVEFTYTVIR